MSPLAAPSEPGGGPPDPDLIDELSVGVFLLAPGGLVQHANRACLRLRGLTIAAVRERPLAASGLIGDAPTLHEAVAQALAQAGGGSSPRFDTETNDRQGLPVHLAITLRSLHQGPRIGWHIGEVHNITGHRQIESALRDSQREIARAQQIARVGSWSWIVDGDFVTWSAELYRIFGLDPRRWPPSWAEHGRLYTPESFARLSQAVQAALEAGTAFALELEFVHASGMRGWLQAQGEVERDLTGAVIRLRGTVQDVTERRRLQDVARRELEQAKALAAALEEQAQLEREIAQFLAHEIRQPLNNASAALQSASHAIAGAETGRSNIAQAPLSHAQGVLTHVIGALNNSLAAASLLMTGNTAVFSETDLDTLTGLVVHDIHSGQRQRVTVRRRAGARTVRLQPNLMRLALCNLLNNALAYSPAGSPVSLQVSDSDDPLAILFEVFDEGGGIPDEVLARAFEKGVRGPNAYSQAGAGLGLYIVQRVARMHGGGLVAQAAGPQGPHCLRLTIPQGLDG